MTQQHPAFDLTLTPTLSLSSEIVEGIWSWFEVALLSCWVWIESFERAFLTLKASSSDRNWRDGTGRGLPSYFSRFRLVSGTRTSFKLSYTGLSCSHMKALMSLHLEHLLESDVNWVLAFECRYKYKWKQVGKK